jgi:hypothetical protein
VPVRAGQEVSLRDGAFGQPDQQQGLVGSHAGDGAALDKVRRRWPERRAGVVTVEDAGDVLGRRDRGSLV